MRCLLPNYKYVNVVGITFFQQIHVPCEKRVRYVLEQTEGITECTNTIAIGGYDGILISNIQPELLRGMIKKGVREDFLDLTELEAVPVFFVQDIQLGEGKPVSYLYGESYDFEDEDTNYFSYCFDRANEDSSVKRKPFNPFDFLNQPPQSVNYPFR